MSQTELLTPDAIDVATAPRRVLHIVNGEYYAGAERVQDLLAQELPKYDYSVEFVCVKPDRFPDLRQAQNAPLSLARVKHPLDRRAMRRIAEIAAGEGYELIHSHTARSGWASAAVSRLTGIPVVHTMHDVALANPKNRLRALLDRFTIRALRQADHLIAVSPTCLQVAERLQLGRRRSLVRNGVPAGPEPVDRARPKTWTLGFVSLIRPGKGIEVLVRALAELAHRGRSCRLRAVGRFESAECEVQLRSLAAALEVEPNIDFVGFQQDVPSQLRQMDLFVMPSTGPEGLPMVVLEAMAHGLPIVGSAVAGVTDLVRDGVDGCLTPPGDVLALANAIDQFLLGRCDWSRMRRNVHQRHQRNYSATRMASETAAVYDKLLSR